MSREDVATALDEAAAALARAAHALRGTEPAVRESAAAGPERGSVPPSPPASAPQPNPVDTGRCPKHNVPWEQGNWGPYCKQMTDDPAWGKQKKDRDGNPVLWCNLTPKNAPDWVSVHGLPA